MKFKFLTIQALIIIVGVLYSPRSILKSGVSDISFFAKDEIKPISWRLSNETSLFSQSDDIDNLVKRFLKRNAMNGISIAISKDDKLLFAQGYGLADIKDSISVEPRHIFRVASVSKLITAVAIMKLQEEGKLDLDDKVFAKGGVLYREELTPYKDRRLNDITVRHLLMHAGGWTQRYGDPMFNPLQITKRVGVEAPATTDTYLKFVTSRRLHFTPGASSIYSNLGYFLLGTVVSEASGMGLEAYVQNILSPAGICDIHLANNNFSDHFENEVNYYEPEGSLPIPTYSGTGELLYKRNGGNDIKLLGGAGGWVASPVELVKLISVIDGDPAVEDILTEESITEMVSSSPIGFDPLGWRSVNRGGTWVRTGSMPGTQALIKKLPNGFNYAIVTNTSSWTGPSFANSLSALMNKIFRSVDEWPDHDLFNYYEPKPLISLDGLFEEANNT